MVKLSNLFRFDNLLLNYLLPITIFIFIYLFYKYYKVAFIGVREKFTNNVKLCKDNSCGMGCERPTGINDNCPTTIYKDIDGKCHRKCPYVCSDKDKKKSVCKYDECCVGCGYTKIPVHCELGTGDISVESVADNDDDDDAGEKNINEEPSPNKDKTTAKNNNSKSKNLNGNMTDVEDQDLDFKDWSPYVNKWHCSMNVTGTFTECGPLGYNSCG
jgi:hypothetical protein